MDRQLNILGFLVCVYVYYTHLLNKKKIRSYSTYSRGIQGKMNVRSINIRYSTVPQTNSKGRSTRKVQITWIVLGLVRCPSEPSRPTYQTSFISEENLPSFSGVLCLYSTCLQNVHDHDKCIKLVAKTKRPVRLCSTGFGSFNCKYQVIKFGACYLFHNFAVL